MTNYVINYFYIIFSYESFKCFKAIIILLFNVFCHKGNFSIKPLILSRIENMGPCVPCKYKFSSLSFENISAIYASFRINSSLCKDFTKSVFFFFKTMQLFRRVPQVVLILFFLIAYVLQCAK